MKMYPGTALTLKITITKITILSLLPDLKVLSIICLPGFQIWNTKNFP